MKKYVVARVSDIPAGEHRVVEVNGRRIGIYNLDGTFHAILSRCPHMGADLCKGAVVGDLRSDGPGHFDYDGERRSVLCPWHGWEFDIETGQSFFDARRMRVRSFDVATAGGEELVAEIERAVEEGGRVKGPYVAEKIDVAAEDEYVVLSMVR